MSRLGGKNSRPWSNSNRQIKKQIIKRYLEGNACLIRILTESVGRDHCRLRGFARTRLIKKRRSLVSKILVISLVYRWLIG